jgi:hypothetical protein
MHAFLLLVVLHSVAGSPIKQYEIYQYDTNMVNLKMCNVTITGPASSRHNFPMQVFPFYSNSTTTSFRISPDVAGFWNWLISCPDSHKDSQTITKGTFQCIQTTDNSTGGLLLDQLNPGKLITANGNIPFHTIGLEVDWLFALNDQTSTPSLSTFLNDVVKNGVNTLVVSIYSNYSTWNTHLPDRVPPKVSPTKSTPWMQNGALNFHFFEHWDVVLKEATKRNLQIHIMFYVGNKNVR